MFTLPFLGHHETPPEAHNKLLEKFPDNFPRNQANVIPPTTDKKVEEVRFIHLFTIFFYIYIL